MKPVPSKGPRARFRRAREVAGFSQIGLSRLLERSTAYVAHIENGRLNPSVEERAKLAELLGTDVDELFAGFPKPKAERDAELGHEILKLCGEHSDGEIAMRLRLGRGQVRGRRIAAGGKTRPSLPMLARQLAPEGKLMASAAGKKYGFDAKAVRKAIDGERIRGEKLKGPFGPHEVVYVVVESEFLEDVASLRCRYPGCDRSALAESGCCSGAHAQGLETRSEWWSKAEGRRFLDDYMAGVIRPTCWLCGSGKERLAPAHFAKAWREERRMVCETCGPLWIAALIGARSRARLASSPMNALENALEVAEQFEADLRVQLRGREGRPRAFAIDLVIEALFIGRGLSRVQVTGLLNRGIREGRLSMMSDEVGDEYVRTRQKRAKIKKRQRALS
jgi:transcriptional regulator with XRE-family HTH domain